MSARALGAAAVAIMAASFGVAFVGAQEPGIELDAPPVDGTYTWKDVDGEAGYRVFGSVGYISSFSCIGLPVRTDSIEFSEELPADSTSFTLPVPDDPGIATRWSLVFTVEALDESGERIAQNGHAFNADQFCTPAQIAEELAAAGAGFEPEGRPLGQLAALIAAAGAGLTAGGWLLRRRAD